MHKLILIALFGLGACATESKYKENLNSWMGQREGSLIASWGPPDSVYTSDTNTKYLTYNRQQSTYVPGVAPTYQTHCSFGVCTTDAIGGSDPYMIDSRCKTTFTVAGGMISSWRYEGNACRA